MSNFPFLYSTVWKSKIFSLHLYSNQFPFFLKHRPIDWNVCLPCHTKLLLCGLINVFKFFGPSFLLKSAFSLHVCLLIRKKTISLFFKMVLILSTHNQTYLQRSRTTVLISLSKFENFYHFFKWKSFFLEL